jgi:hypothetical protein
MCELVLQRQFPVFVLVKNCIKGAENWATIQVTEGDDPEYVNIHLVDGRVLGGDYETNWKPKEWKPMGASAAAAATEGAAEGDYFETTDCTAEDQEWIQSHKETCEGIMNQTFACWWLVKKGSQGTTWYLTVQICESPEEFVSVTVIEGLDGESVQSCSTEVRQEGW